MRKIVNLLIVVLLPLAVTAEQPTLSIGGFAGLDIPIVQDDQGQGSVFGFKANWGALKLITIEPYISFTKFGEPDSPDGDPGLFDGYDGSKIASYGVNGILGGSSGKAGLYPYFLGGIGFFNMKRDITSQDETDFGYNAGLGVEFGLSSGIAIDFRGSLHVIPIDGGGSKKSASITGGLNYFLGNKGE